MKKIGTIKDVYGETCNLTWDGCRVWVDDHEDMDCDSFEDAVECCAISWGDDKWELQLTEEAARTLD